jgi:hypothetical protein
MPTFRIEDARGQSLTDMRLNGYDWKPGDRIPRGTDTLEVIEIRPPEDEEGPTAGTLASFPPAPSSEPFVDAEVLDAPPLTGRFRVIHERATGPRLLCRPVVPRVARLDVLDDRRCGVGVFLAGTCAARRRR